MSKIYSLKTVQKIPVALNEAWDFFSSPKNLASITPGKMGFDIISLHHGDNLYAGQIIEYKVKPLLGIALYWMTEITHVEHEKYFVDEQRFGPFSLWHHQHHFTPIESGIEMTDIVHYKLPFWLIGDIAKAWFVEKQLKELFDYRFKKIEELFGRI